MPASTPRTPDESLTPAERRLRAQRAANTRWAKADAAERARHGERLRAVMDRKFEQQVDPDGTLPPAERAKRVKAARAAYYQGLAFKSTRARRARKLAQQQANKSA